MTEQVELCRVTPGLVDHVLQLLADAELSPTTASSDGLVTIAVPDSQLEHAQAVVGLVLPDLLKPATDSTRLSDRLIRRDSSSEPLQLLDGRFALDATEPETPAEPEPAHYVDEDDFVPPPPPAIPRPRDPVARFAWAAVLLGPILLLVTAITGMSGFTSALGLGLFVGGFVTLIVRHDEAPREGWDDGAVV